MNLESNLFAKNKWIIISGASSCILGMLLLGLKSWFIEFLTTSILILKPNSLVEANWRYVPDVPLNIYLFNWTNPEDFHNLSIRPKFEQLGPYKFKEDIEKANIIWNNNNTVTYNIARHVRFDETIPFQNLSAPFTTVDIVFLGTAHLMRYMSYPLKKLLSAYISASAPYVYSTKPTKEFLYEGFDDFLLDLARYLPFAFADIPRFDKFSFLSMGNKSIELEGIYNIGNGIDGTFDVRNWNFNNVTTHFHGSCAKVHGSTGELFSRKPSKDCINIFLSSICRNVRLDFEGEVMVEGILGYKYSIGDGMLDNGTLIPENECYCNGDCIPSGMINMTSCRYGMPIFLSLPNFYDADPIYLEAVEGLYPDKDKHEAYTIIEPNTGIPLRTSIRIQVNFLMHPIEDISVFEDVREVFLPLIWIDQTTTLSSKNYLLLTTFLMVPNIISVVGSIFVALGIVLTCGPFKPLLISYIEKMKKQKPYISPKPEAIPLRCDDKML